MKRIIVTLFFALLFISGCSTIRNARDAQRETDKRLPAGERSATLSEMGLNSGQTLTLSDAIEVSLQWHPSMLNATQSLVSAQIALHQAGVNMRPNVSSSAGYSESYSRSELNDWDTKSSYNLTAGANLSWVLYDFGYSRAVQHQATAQYIAASEAYRDAGIQRIYQVRNAYFSLARAEALYTVSEESLRQYQLLLEQAELKLQIGTGRKYDVTKARVDCSNAALSLINASNAVTTAQANLNSQLGLATPATFVIEPSIEMSNIKDAVSATPEFAAESDSPDFAEYLEYFIYIARDSQPALRIQSARVKAASAAVDMAIANMYPSLSVSGNASYNGGQTKSFSWGWGTSLAQSLFSGWGRSDAVRQSVAALRIARSNLAQQEQKTLSDLTTALANLDAAEETKTVSEQLLEQAKENLEIVTEQFDVGKSSILERSDAQLVYTQASANRVTSQYALEIAKANLFAILGLY